VGLNPLTAKKHSTNTSEMDKEKKKKKVLILKWENSWTAGG
jgi:hypothetical protein